MIPNSSSQKGASAVEFALLLPLLIMITFGIIEFGLYMYDQQIITNASREGARAGIVATGGNPRVTDTAISSVVQNYCGNYLVTFGDGGKSCRLDPDPPVGYSSGAAYGQDLEIQVEYDYSFLILPFSSRTMKAVTVMKYE